jgi:hypothetical protein
MPVHITTKVIYVIIIYFLKKISLKIRQKQMLLDIFLKFSIMLSKKLNFE